MGGAAGAGRPPPGPGGPPPPPGPGGAPGAGAAGAGAAGGNGPPVEFKQAKDYVTTIKKRFANEPHQATYKAFLKILHHYQEEQRNIMDVLEQVRL
jgi:histone deacetylase complex regulatory component SIN3